MKFLRSELLFAIWAIPFLFVIFFYGMKRRRKILTEFSSVRGLAAIAPEIADNRRWLKALLVLGSLAFMVFALAGPRYGYKWQKIERKGIDIIIAIDCSRSMLATDIRPTRLDRAKREIVDLLNLLKGDRVGLVSFAGTSFLQCPLTLDYEAFYIFLNALTPDFLPVGGTDIAGAIETALAGFNANDNSEKAVILITDGESTGGDPVQAAQKAKAAGVKLFCIGVGKADGAPIPDAGGGFKKDKTGNIVITRLDEETLRQSALLTGGNYVRSVAGDMDLDTIYNRDIRGKTKATTLSSSRKKIWEDRFQWFLLPALLALLAEMFVPEVRKSALMVVFGMTLLFHHAPAWAANVRQSMQMGQKAYQSGEYGKALKHFIDAQLEDPERPSIYYNIGNANYKKSDYSAALENYTQALKTADNALKQKSLYNRGNSNFRLGKLKDAIADYEAALKLDPQDVQAAQNLEFVKKRMEMKKEHPPEDGKQRSDDSGQKSKDGEKNPAESEKKPEQGEQKPEENGQKAENRGQKSEEKGQQTKDKAQRTENNGQEDQKQPTAGASEQNPKPESDQIKQAERILNRLQDMPGKAMMPPLYQPEHIDKDW